MKAFGRQYNGTEGDVTVSATFEFPNKVTASMVLTAEASKDHMKELNHVLYIGTKGNIVIRGSINNPAQIFVNGRVIETSTDIKGQDLSGYNWSNSSGLRYQVEDIRKSLMEKKINSEIHGKEQSMLLIETIAQLMKDIGYNVKGITPKDYEFKRL